MRKLLFLLTAMVYLSTCSVVPNYERQGLVIEPGLTSADLVIENPKKDSSCHHTETALNCVKVVEVYDGDTIFIDIPEAPPPFRKKLGVRIAGIDAPELSSKDACEKSKAQEAKSILKSLIYNANRIDIVEVGRDKYFRILGVVLADGKLVADELIERNLAYPYFVKMKLPKNWCN